MSQSDKDTPAEQVVRPFADFLREQSKGNTHEELSEALHDLVQRVADTGRQGSLVLTISVKPMKGADNGALMVSDAIKLKLPEHDRKASIFFSHDGNLRRTDPHQLAFEGLRTVAGESVDTATGEIKEKRA
jgi:hypothetical protein